MGRKVPELNDPNYRELIFGNYRIIYGIFEEKIQILRIIHSSSMLSL
ncbi:MAG: type II toxin-antitoxin system RelE/ParE family toxin [Candidatus Lokiarchaeota archaeon]|nr:type II toxin-antitoxin system RelE/ParE family toxin [Candidatus Lokiarchaeota archaeon]